MQNFKKSWEPQVGVLTITKEAKQYEHMTMQIYTASIRHILKEGGLEENELN